MVGLGGSQGGEAINAFMGQVEKAGPGGGPLNLATRWSTNLWIRFIDERPDGPLKSGTGPEVWTTKF